MRAGELFGGGLQNISFGINAGLLTHGFKFEITDGDGQQIGWDRLRHSKAVIATTRCAGGGWCTHYRQQVFIGLNAGTISQAHRGRILNRDPASGVNRLILAKHKGLRFRRGLFFAQPLQA